MVNTEDLCDAHEVAGLLGLSHPNSVFGYLRRYDDLPRPVLGLGKGRVALWLRPEVEAWRRPPTRRRAVAGVSRLRSNDRCWCGSGQKLKRCHGDHRAHRRPPVVTGRGRALRPVPATIARPPYVATGGVRAPAACRSSRRGARSPAPRRAASPPRCWPRPATPCAPGVTTEQLDAVAHEAYVRRGAYPSTLGYKGYTQVGLHVGQRGRVPRDPRRPSARAGDIVNIDVTAYVDGMHGDTSATFAVGGPDALDAPTGRWSPPPARPRSSASPRSHPAARCGSSARPSSRRLLPGLRRRPGLRRPRHRRDVPRRPPRPPRRRAAPSRRARPAWCFTIEPMLTAGTDRHHAVGRRLDRGQRRRPARRPVRAHGDRHRDGVEVLTVTARGGLSHPSSA